MLGMVAIFVPIHAGDCADVPQPRVQLAGLSCQLLSQEPKVTTPVGCAVDTAGNLLVIESNTHFRPEGYAGPLKDRLLRYSIADRNQRMLAPVSVLLDTPTWAMQVVQGPDGWIYLSTRSQVVRLQADHPERQEVVARLETAGNYPHNGLCGLAYGPDRKLYVGMGENFGEPFAFVDAKGEGVHGGGEGGNIFRCQPDGSGIERIATGFWNPFGLCFDDSGRLWCVDNDPDASPPCRLVHVVPGADYGFQFRYGRAGTHPLLAWNGQLPGTVGYAAGTGEAPCAVVFHRGFLWVSSWGDNRIERYRLELSGTSFKGIMEVAVQGDTNFRPVGLAIGPDQSIYVTDWVDRSYTLHGKGRIWRLDFDSSFVAADRPAPVRNLDVGPQRESYLGQPERRIINVFPKGDPFERASALWKLAHTPTLDRLTWESLTDPEQRVGLLMTYRWLDLDPTSRVVKMKRQRLCLAGLSDPSSRVQIAALRWIADAKEVELADEVNELLNAPTLTSDVCRIALGTLEWLEKPAVEGNVVGGHKTALKLVANPNRSNLTRSIALGVLNVNDTGLTVEMLGELAMRNDSLGREAVRVLALKSDAKALPILAAIAKSSHVGEQQRADGVMGLGREAANYAATLKSLTQDPSLAVRTEATRALEHIEKKSYEQGRPPETDLEAWTTRFAGTLGDRDAGWRVFFRAGAGQCAACHSFQGRGANVGPDLSTLSGTQDRKRVLGSIVQPSREIGPLYVPWQILTTDGRVLSGVKLHAPGVGEKVRYLASNGETFDLSLTEIEEQKMSDVSIMPNGLCNTLSDSELTDLLALLGGP